LSIRHKRWRRVPNYIFKGINIQGGCKNGDGTTQENTTKMITNSQGHWCYIAQIVLKNFKTKTNNCSNSLCF
jgi:hypothetical protein